MHKLSRNESKITTAYDSSYKYLPFKHYFVKVHWIILSVGLVRWRSRVDKLHNVLGFNIDSIFQESDHVGKV